MKTKHNNGLTARFVVLLALLSATVPVAQAQEYIKEIVDLKSIHSIVREYKTDSRIVYNHTGAKNNGGEFLMVTESGTTTTLLTIGDDAVILDFEIYRDTVFFCGFVSTPEQPLLARGYVGCFPLATYPTCTVWAYHANDFNSFSKLDVLISKYDGKRHLIMTGRTREDYSSCLVDFPAISGGPAPVYYITTGFSYGVFDDVAVIKDYVVATVRQTAEHQTGFLYYFAHPAPGLHMFYGIIDTVKVDDGINSEMLLEQCSNNFFSVVYRKTSSISNTINIAGYEGLLYNMGVVSILVTATTQEPKDIKFDADDKDIDVLCWELGQTDTNSVIYHIDYNGDVTGRCFYEQDVHSIDYLATDPGNFFASGRGKTGYLWVYKYMPTNEKPKCPEMIYPEYLTREGLFALGVLSKEAKVSIINPTIVLQDVASKGIGIRCYYDMKNEDSIINMQ